MATSVKTTKAQAVPAKVAQSAKAVKTAQVVKTAKAVQTAQSVKATVTKPKASEAVTRVLPATAAAVAKKAVVKKSAVKAPTVKAPAAKKPVANKPVAKKAAVTRTPAAEAAAVFESAVVKPVAQKTVAKKALAKQSVAKESVATPATVKPVPVIKKTAAEKVASTRATAKVPAVNTAPVKTPVAKKAAAAVKTPAAVKAPAVVKAPAAVKTPAAAKAPAAPKAAVTKKTVAEVVETPESFYPDYWDEACRYLVKKDRILRKIIPKYKGMGGLKSHGDAFSTLARSIVSQQISTTAAAAVWSRLEQSVRGKFTAAKVLALELEALRGCGLSVRKAEYLRDLALHVHEGRLNVKSWQHAEDEAIIAELTAVRGIGRWTAEMFLMFHLMRPNVLPLDDLGLIQGISRNYFSGEPVSRSDAREVAEGWKPWRTVATWYMWRSLAQPQAY